MLPIRKEKKLNPKNYSARYTLRQTYLKDHAEDILFSGAAGAVPVADGGEGLQDEVNLEDVHAREVILVEGVKVDARKLLVLRQVVVEAPQEAPETR
jgi:hypothetical protein